VELSTFLLVFLLVILTLIFLGWLILSRLTNLFEHSPDQQSMMLMQQQIGELRAQLSNALDHGAQSIQQQLGQMIGHVNERLRENAEVLNRAQQSLG
jgi:predicted PurR-regulated permease PerM